MDIQKENNLIQEAFEVEADEVGLSLDQKWGDYENPYENSDTALAFNLFKKGWQAAKAHVPEGFVLVPKKPDVDKAWSIALKRIVPPPKTNDAIQKELMCKKYVDDLYSEQDRILLDYEAMIEAQEPANS